MEITFDKVSLIINHHTPLEKTILNNISFNIKESGIYGFIGSSNSGKTAIGELISSLMIPSEGKVQIKTSSRKIKLKKLRSQIGYVFKNPYDMFTEKTVIKEIESTLKYNKIKEKNEKLLDTLKLLNLDKKILKMNPHNLNLSDAIKVAITSILIYNPEIIILDEPTIGLNKKDKMDLERLLKQLKNRFNKIVIVLSKDINFCYQTCDYFFLMEKTKLITHGDKTLLTDEELLTSLNLETPEIVKFIKEARKQNHKLHEHTNILDLIKEVYRDAK